ncbi:MAG: hypothetical protein H7145_05570, partial [Akkermansiaceae bacterium]|nr:hypothetical protein [Armatimonadota bacterium]
MHSNIRHAHVFSDASLIGLIMVALMPVALLDVALAQQDAKSVVAGASVTKGAVSVSDSAITSGMGRLITAGASEFKLPARIGGDGSAEVHTWSGSAYKPGCAPFLQALLQSALT